MISVISIGPKTQQLLMTYSCLIPPPTQIKSCFSFCGNADFHFHRRLRSAALLQERRVCDLKKKNMKSKKLQTYADSLSLSLAPPPLFTFFVYSDFLSSPLCVSLACIPLRHRSPDNWGKSHGPLAVPVTVPFSIPSVTILARGNAHTAS